MIVYNDDDNDDADDDSPRILARLARRIPVADNNDYDVGRVSLGA